MATRQEIQIAGDLIRFVNIVNDLLDTSIPVARGQIKVKESPTSEERDMTVDEIKTFLMRMCQNVEGYKTKLVNFLNVPENRQWATNGLLAWGVNLDITKQELLNMAVVKDYVYSTVAEITTIDGLKTLADYIEVNVPRLPLIRRL